MIRKLGVLMGSLFLFGGILRFVPGVIKTGCTGIFMVNTPHNILHIGSGGMFVIASMNRFDACGHAGRLSLCWASALATFPTVDDRLGRKIRLVVYRPENLHFLIPGTPSKQAS